MSCGSQNEGAVDENLPMNKYVFSWDVLRNFSDFDSEEEETFGINALEEACVNDKEEDTFGIDTLEEACVNDKEEDTFSIDTLEEACVNDSFKQKEDETKDAIEVMNRNGGKRKVGLAVDDPDPLFNLLVDSLPNLYNDLVEDLFSQLDGFDNGEVMVSDHLKALKRLTSRQLISELKNESGPYLFFGEALNRYMEYLDRADDMDDDIDWNTFFNYEGSRMAGVYSLPEVLNPIYEEFFSKYKVFSAEGRRLGFQKRRCIVFITSCVLHEMCTTKVVDIRRERIRHWLCSLKKLEMFNQVQLGFMLDHIRQMAKVHYLVQARHIVDSRSSELRGKIGQLLEQEQELTEKLKMIRGELRYYKIEKEAYGVYKAFGARRLKMDYKDALQNKWRTCYESSADYQKQRSA